MMGRRHGAQTFPTVLMTNTDSVYPCLFPNFYSIFQGAKFYCSIFKDANVQHGSNGLGGLKRIFGGLPATFSWMLTDLPRLRRAVEKIEILL